jgi:hypothetical protein
VIADEVVAAHCVGRAAQTANTVQVVACSIDRHIWRIASQKRARIVQRGRVPVDDQYAHGRAFLVPKRLAH